MSEAGLAKRQRTEPSAGVHPAPESSAPATSASSTAAADHQEADALVFVCDPQRARLPSASAEAETTGLLFAVRNHAPGFADSSALAI